MKKRGNKPENLINRRFGKLIAVKDVGRRGKSSSHFWECVCDCGGSHIVSAQHLKLGVVSRCNNCRKKTDKTLLNEAKKRFFNKVEKDGDCWIWKGINIRGYGVMFYRKPIRAHRFSYMIHHGDLKDGLYVCHKCDNPLCVNPDHLYQGTPLDNSRDSVRRCCHPVGERSHFSKLSEAQVKHIISSNERGIDLAKKYGVNKNTISRIRRGRQWKHLTQTT